MRPLSLFPDLYPFSDHYFTWRKIFPMKMDRTKTRLLSLENEQSHLDYVPGHPEDRLNMVWDITVALWGISTKGEINDKSRLQRNFAVLRKT